MFMLNKNPSDHQIFITSLGDRIWAMVPQASESKIAATGPTSRADQEFLTRLQKLVDTYKI